MEAIGRYARAAANHERQELRSAKIVAAGKKVDEDNKQLRQQVVSLEAQVGDLSAKVALLEAEAAKSPVVGPDSRVVSEAEWGAAQREVSHLRDAHQVALSQLEAARANGERTSALLREEVAALQSQNQALSEKVTWSLGDGLPFLFKKLLSASEFTVPLGQVTAATTQAGFCDGVRAGFRAASRGLQLNSVRGYDPQAEQKVDMALSAFRASSFPFLDQVKLNSHLSVSDIMALEPSVSMEEDLE